MKKFMAGFVSCLMLFSIAFAAEQFVTQKATFPVIINGEEKTDWGDVPPLVVNGRTMLPLKEVGEALNVDVEWDSANKAVVIGEPLQAASSDAVVIQPKVVEEKVETDDIVYKVEVVAEDGLKIRVSGDLKIGAERFHMFELTNTSNQDIEYGYEMFGCNTGLIVEIPNNLTEYEGYPLLKSGTLKQGETVKGMIGFSNSIRATNRPEFRYKNTAIKVSDM